MIVQLTDIDECELGSAMCHQNASCENTVGGYLCSCAVGLTGNGFNCSGKHLGIIISMETTLQKCNWYT